MFKAYAVTFGGGTLVLLGLLTLAFTVLKMTHVVAWSWAAVLTPLWLPMAIASAFTLGVLCFLGVIAVCVYLFARKEESL